MRTKILLPAHSIASRLPRIVRTNHADFDNFCKLCEVIEQVKHETIQVADNGE